VDGFEVLGEQRVAGEVLAVVAGLEILRGRGRRTGSGDSETHAAHDDVVQPTMMIVVCRHCL